MFLVLFLRMNAKARKREKIMMQMQEAIFLDIFKPVGELFPLFKRAIFVRFLKNDINN